MDIYSFAFDMEKDSESYYRELAEKCTNEGFKNILNMLADEERKHQEYILELQKNNKSNYIESTILQDIKNIFAQMRDNKEDITINVSQLELYKKAQELEKESEEFYKEKANEASNDEEKDILIKLSKEENKHYFLLENIIEFVNRPQTWVENAEFNHLDEY